MQYYVPSVVGAIVLLAVNLPLQAADVHDAVEAENLPKVQQLLAAKPALVNLQNEAGATPLHLAAGLNNTNLVNLLLSKGANIRAVTKQGWTPLHWAAHMNAAGVASILMAKGADGQAKAMDGKTPLQVAIAERADAVAAILLKQTPAAYTDSAVDKSYDEAEKARASGDLNAAYDLFSKLVNNDPGNEKYNFALGATCYSMNDYSRAQLAFERVLQKNPANGRARVELARCLMMMGEDSSARAEFQKVLATNPPADVQRNINAHLAEMQNRSKKWTFAGRVDASAFHDDNVNVGPDSERISIAPIVFGAQSIDELTVQKASQPAKSTGYSSSVFGGAVYDGGEPGKWSWGSTAAYFQNWMSDRPQNESQFYQFDTGPRYGADRSYMEMPIRASHISTGGKSLVDMFGVYPGYMYAYGPQGDWRFGTMTGIESRKYATLSDRDGAFVSAGESARYYFGESRHSVIMGLALSHDFTKVAAYEYTGIEWQLGAEFKLPWEVTGYGRIRQATSSYADREPLAPADRKDTQWQYTIGFSRMITSWWGADANYQATANTSTFTLYEYNRHVATVSTFCSF